MPLNFHEFHELFRIREIKFVKCYSYIGSYIEISGKKLMGSWKFKCGHPIFEEFVKIYYRENNPVYGIDCQQ